MLTINDQEIRSAEMKFLRMCRGCTLRDEIRNEYIRLDLETYSVNDRIQQNRQEWIHHIERMVNSKIDVNMRTVGRKQEEPYECGKVLHDLIENGASNC